VLVVIRLELRGCVCFIAVAEQRQCKYFEFTCDDLECIPSTSVCDDFPDCSDGSDEGSYCRK